MSHAITPNTYWIFFRPLEILARTGIARDCLSVVIINATLKVLGWMKPKSLLGNINLHSQHERKATEETSSWIWEGTLSFLRRCMKLLKRILDLLIEPDG